MIHEDLRFMLSLLCRTAQGAPLPAPHDVNWETIYKICESQQVDNLLAYAVLQGGYAIPAHISEALLKSMAVFARHDARQSAVFHALCEALCEAEADYLPLKGVELKTLYPYPDMRRMVDIDVLVRQGDFPRIRKALLGAGFRFVLESNHEYVFEKDHIQAELHKYPVPTYNDDLHAYYGDGWHLAKHADGHRYRLSSEDTFVFVLTHFAKHYRDAGVGMRPVFDLCLCLEKLQPDTAYVRKELEKLNLAAFFDHVLQLLDAWCGGGEWTPLAEEMTRFILESGSMGTGEKSALASAIRKENEAPEGKLRRLFPKAEKLYQSYPILRKSHAFLPFVWMHRILRAAFTIRKIRRLQNERKAWETDGNKNVYRTHMEKVGLDILNGRGQL